MVTQADVERVQEEIKPQMMVLIIIHLALMLGAGAYAVFVLVTTVGQDKAADVQPFNTMLALIAVVALCAVMSFVIPSILVATLKRNVTWKDDPANPILGNPSQQPSSDATIADTPAKAIMGATMTSRIFGLALLEGPMFLCSFLASKYSPWWLVGSVVLFMLMAIRFPLSRPLAEWIADEEEQLLESQRNA
jgi:fatty acid desaturase